jgi:ABC-type transport system substrate-binding protein
MFEQGQQSRMIVRAMAGRKSAARRRLFLYAAAAMWGTALAVVSAVAHAAPDPAKVIRWYFETGENGFDPVRISDLYSATVNEAIFERLLTYDYLARPAKLVPMVTEAMPEVTDGGRTYTFRIKKGIHFSSDPAFKGVRRELTAEDFVYSFKRFMDPKYSAPYAFLIEGKLVGLDELAAQAKKTGKFDYDTRIAGVEAVDRYTLRFRLKNTDYNFPFIVAHTSLCAVAREVIEAYGEDTMGHPVGTGPYVLKEWKRRSRIVLESNPEYRGYVWDFKPMDTTWDRDIVAAMKGKQMPQVGRVEISIIDEVQSRWLAFKQKELDYVSIPSTFAPSALDGDQLKPELVQEGVRLERSADPDLTYTAFNIRDPVIGGFAKEKIALRRAMAMAYDIEEEIKVIRKGQAVHLQMPIPPGVVGHDPNYRSIIQNDPETANKLLDYFGYKKGADGWRTLPDGKPLVISLATEPSSTSRELDELWHKSLNKIGIRMNTNVAPLVDNIQAAKKCKLQMWGAAWIADYPDGDNFVQLLYGPNTGQSNNGCYESPAFDAYYRKSLTIPNSPERNRLFLEMSRQMEVDGAWSVGISRMRSEVIRPWVQGFKKHPILQADFMYLDVEPHRP